MASNFPMNGATAIYNAEFTGAAVTPEAIPYEPWLYEARYEEPAKESDDDKPKERKYQPVLPNRKERRAAASRSRKCKTWKQQVSALHRQLLGWN